MVARLRHGAGGIPLPAFKRRTLFALVVLGLMLLICAPLFVDPIATGAPRPKDGRVSFAAWGPLDAPVELAGEWRLTWLGGPGGVRPGTQAPIAIPGGWSGAFPATGTARMELILSGLRPGRYTLHIPLIFGASRVFVDGRPMGGFGRIGMSAATTRSEVRSYELPIVADGQPITIAVDVAAYHHRDSGMVDAPVFGEADAMRRWVAREWAKDFLFETSLLLLAATTLVGFLYRRQDRASLYLSLTALTTIPGTAVISYDNILLLAVPGLSFPAMLALQYLLTGALSLIFLLAYTRALFPQETPRRMFWALQAFLGVYLLAQVAAFVFGGTRAASQVAVLFPLVIAVSFIGTIVITARAALRGRDGAVVSLLGVAIFTVFILNATLTYSGLVPPDFLLGARAVSLGMLMMLFAHFVVVAERWTLAIVAAERTNADLRELLEVSSAVTSEIHLEALLTRIVEVTSRMLDADRCTLLLHDVRTGELWSLVAEGLASREIRIPSTTGLAGHVFTTGETLEVENVYADPRFNRAIDEATGYRTRSMLAMPITSRDGRRLGVIQALNRRDAKGFSASDAARMGAFASQAAIAIENATLFSQVTEQRNYNESVLRSMSNGVVTIGRDDGVGKLNLAACRILDLPAETDIEGVDARTWLAQRNPWLLDEIDAVAATGESKLLLDVDVVTNTGDTVALNVSIVPLRTDGAVIGILLLIEDISEGKRMQGAMRRFMTQKVVDQVLGRGDELMFGTACNASVLFADIRNFTTMAETLTARETVDMLNEAFTDFVEAVAAQEGVLDKFIGDAIMAVYGAPLSTGQDALNAVESGAQMLRMLAELNRRRSDRALPSLRLGIGVATGEVVAGTIGSPKRMDYTVIGDSVNLASRLQDLTKAYGVEMLVDETTAAAVAGRHRLRELDLILVRGRQRPTTIFQVFGPDADARAMRLTDAYQRGRASLAKRDWPGAVAAFAEAVAIDGEDVPARIMLDRARILAEQPPQEDWDGVWRNVAAK